MDFKKTPGKFGTNFEIADHERRNARIGFEAIGREVLSGKLSGSSNDGMESGRLVVAGNIALLNSLKDLETDAVQSLKKQAEMTIVTGRVALEQAEADRQV